MNTTTTPFRTDADFQAHEMPLARLMEWIDAARHELLATGVKEQSS